MLQSPPHPRSPILIFLELGSPELDAALQMGPSQGSVEGQENLPHPAAHTPPHAPQDPIGLLGSQGTLLAHGQLVIHQHSQSLSTGQSQPVLVHGVVPPQVQDPARALVELCGVPLCPTLCPETAPPQKVLSLKAAVAPSVPMALMAEAHTPQPTVAM